MNIILPGPVKVVSFTDDTTPNTLETKKRSVSISAMVRRQSSLDWYYTLLYLCRNVKGELKSKDAVQAYKNLDSLKRNTLWSTLKLVQINITDSLPYRADTERLVKDALSRDDVIDVIRHRANARDPLAMNLLEKLNNHTAERILFDAPSRRLSWTLRFTENRFTIGTGRNGLSGYIKSSISPRNEIDIERLKSRTPGAIIRAATEWTAKSASAFSDAIDASYTEFYFRDHPVLNPIYRALRESHAFDDGNKKYIDLIEDERCRLAKQMSFRSYWSRKYPLAKLHGNVDSKESYYIQASDLAGGIASLLYEDDGIFAVALNFEYVMFNGKRISQNEAYETMKKWKEAGYYR